MPLAFFCLAIVVGVFVSAFYKAPLVLDAGGWGGGGVYTFLYPALFVVLFCLAFLCVSLFFGGSPHVTACGRVSSHTIVSRW